MLLAQDFRIGLPLIVRGCPKRGSPVRDEGSSSHFNHPHHKRLSQRRPIRASLRMNHLILRHGKWDIWMAYRKYRSESSRLSSWIIRHRAVILYLRDIIYLEQVVETPRWGVYLKQTSNYWVSEGG
jgi:hypothetical protein